METLEGFIENGDLAKAEEWWVVNLLFDIIEQNSFGCIEHASFGGSSKRVYVALSRVNHDCVPNAAKRTFLDGQMDVHCLEAVRDIEQGEEVTISYLATSDLANAGTAARRRHLEECWKFSCACEACRRNILPSELPSR